jgi:transposase
MERRLDLSFIDATTKELYSSTGRPSVDPQLLVRMMMVGYLFGITSERRLCEEVQLNLAYRSFRHLSLEDKVPEHSTFNKNRHGHFAQSTLFRDMFYSVVQQAIAAGLVKAHRRCNHGSG